MTDKFVEGGPLTADTIKLLRTADGVSFHFHEGTQHPNAWVQMSHDIKHAGSTHTLHTALAAEHRFTIYEGTDGTSGRRMPVKAYSSVSPAKFNPHWVTAAKALRTGDRLYLHWTGNDSSLNLKDAGLVLVEFDLEVARRVGKSGREERLVFRLHTLLTRAAASTLEFPSTEYTINS